MPVPTIGFIPAILGDNTYIVIGVLIVVLSISWLRRPLWSLIKRGFSRSSTPTPKAPKA